MSTLQKKPRPSLKIQPKSSQEIIIKYSPSSTTSKNQMTKGKPSNFFNDAQKQKPPLSRTYTMHKSQQFFAVKQNELTRNIDESIQLLKGLKKGFNISSRFQIENQVFQMQKLLNNELKKVELQREIQSEKMSKIIAQHQTQQLINRQKENIIHLQKCIKGRV